MTDYDDSPDAMHGPARVQVEVGSRVIVGDIKTPDIAYKSRVSDVVNDQNRRFLPLVDVELLDGPSGRVIGRSQFVLVRLDAVDVITPLREPGHRSPLD